MEKKQEHKKKLGRGIDALLGAYEQEERSKEEVLSVSVENIVADPNQPRKNFPEAPLKELAESIKEHGIIQPILVTKQGTSYQIIAGERRFRAAQMAKLKEVPVIVRSLDKEQPGILSLIENIQREDLNPIEEAMAFKELLSREDMSQELLSQYLGIARATLANSVRLLRLPSSIQQAVAQGDVSAGHARAILSVQNVMLQEPLFRKTTEGGWSVRVLERIAGRMNQGVSIESAVEDVLGASPSEQGEEQEEPKEADSTSSKKPSKKITQPYNKDAELSKAEKELIIALGTKVKIIGSPKQGKIEIHYYSMQDLDDLIKRLGS